MVVLPASWRKRRRAVVDWLEGAIFPGLISSRMLFYIRVFILMNGVQYVGLFLSYEPAQCKAVPLSSAQNSWYCPLRCTLRIEVSRVEELMNIHVSFTGNNVKR